MGFIIQLDEYQDYELASELARRMEARKKGLCDYCKRPHGSAPPCRFDDRHSGIFYVLEETEKPAEKAL